VTEIKCPLIVTINRRGTTRVVHVNRIRPLVGIKDSDTGVYDQFGSWSTLMMRTCAMYLLLLQPHKAIVQVLLLLVLLSPAADML